MSTESLLPDNRSALERALEMTLRQHLDNNQSPVLQLWRPYECPEKLLPWLADAVGVDEWRPDDPEIDRRNQIATFWPRQREAGQRIALRRAVESLGFTPTFMPWYETGKAPYTLEVRIWLDGRPVDPETESRLRKRVERAMSERDSITISTAFSLSGTQYIGTQLSGGTVITILPGD